MEHLKLEIFDLATAENPKPTTSKYAVLEEDANITITDTSEVFASGDVWSYSFSLNVTANAHIFGTSGDLHGSRLHEQINKRRARLWVDGLPLYLGYLKLDDEVEVDQEGNVDVGFESGQKTFEEMIEGTSAQEVSVGDVVIGVALNRKRVIDFDNQAFFTLDGLAAHANKVSWLKGVSESEFSYFQSTGPGGNQETPYAQRWPKLVKSQGQVFNSSGDSVNVDYTNVQTPYDAGHPFCNLNICYPFKSVNEAGEEQAGRGYTIRYAHGEDTMDGGDNQTRFNNAPNFYLLYFVDRLFKDLGIHVSENQAKDVEDLKRVFLLNYGCHYEEIENDNDYYHSTRHETPPDTPEKPYLSRYGQYYMPLFSSRGGRYDDQADGRLVQNWNTACQSISADENVEGKVLLRELNIRKDGVAETYSIGSVEGKARHKLESASGFSVTIKRDEKEVAHNAYSAYLAYATGENYPKVEISEIVNAMKAMFGVRLIFDNDYSTVRLVLLRNIFRSSDVQEIECDILDQDEKVENSVRGFRMTYGKGTENTSFYYKGFADLFPRSTKTWKDTSDKHDYSQWDPDATYDEIKQYVSAFNRKCYITPVNGNAYGTQVDEDEDVLFPSLFEWAGYMDAEDGDCSLSEKEPETVEEVQCGATPVLMNEVGIVYASLFTGDLKAPSPENFQFAQKIATFGRATKNSVTIYPNYPWAAKDPYSDAYFRIDGLFDLYISEGFAIRLEDNYAISNGGTPFDEIEPGLCLGIMRSSGNNAFVREYDDPDDDENNAWEVVPGDGAVCHPDTCDNYGNEWDYNGQTTITTAAEARLALPLLFPNSNAVFNDPSFGYITGTTLSYVEDDKGEKHRILFVQKRKNQSWDIDDWKRFQDYLEFLSGMSLSDMMREDANLFQIIVETDSSDERARTLTSLCSVGYGGGTLTTPITIDNGVGSTFGRFSLKLRAEKLNPYFNPKEPEGENNKRYLEIDNENLRQRGLTDTFYKEYSYWIRNARIVKRTVVMTLAQYLAIDKTKKVRVGDITGFIRKRQCSFSNKTGMSEVTLEIMYI